MLVAPQSSRQAYPVYTAESLVQFSLAMQAVGVPPRLAPRTFLVVGTNGKSSACATLEGLALRSGKRVATLTSPHFFRFSERLRIQGQPLAPGPFQEVCETYEAIQENFGLTPYDFHLLMMLKLLRTLPLDILALEVEIGFRFSPFQALEADVTLITGIDYDHLELLGDHREKIAAEKSGALRKGGIAVVADKAPPASLRSEIESLEVEAHWQGQHWNVTKLQLGHWALTTSAHKRRYTLPIPTLALPSVGGAVVVWELLMGPLPEALLEALMPELHLEGRFQKLPGEPLTLFDIASNPQAVRLLFRRLLELELEGALRGWQVVCAMHRSSLVEGSLSGLSFQPGLTWHFPYLADDFEPPARLQALFPERPSQTAVNLKVALHRARTEAALHQHGVVVFGDIDLIAQSLSILQPALASRYPLYPL